ncbi:hypothetical protein HKX48_004338 [Thoreauomyces humboldtii]|nr:hypothetical protein HKX48_004338 [Thoreauomyces humboldtii]
MTPQTVHSGEGGSSSPDTRKTVLITGCSSGIGRALALNLHQRKGPGGVRFRVFATARKLESMKELAAKGIETFKLDVTNEQSVAALLAELQLLTTHHGLDYLYNVAGQPSATPALDIDIEKGRGIFETNYWGVVRMNTTFQTLLIQARGTIVHISSMGAYMPLVLNSVYTSSKAALNAYSNTLRYEMAPLGVHVISVSTGAVKTDIGSTQKYNLSLPTGSFYGLGVAERTFKLITDSMAAGQKVDKYAESVVSQVLGRGRWYHLWSKRERPAQIWAGAGATSLWFATFLPVEIFTLVQDMLYGFSRMLATTQRRRLMVLRGDPDAGREPEPKKIEVE